MNTLRITSLLLMLFTASLSDLFGQQEPAVAPGDRVRVSASSLGFRGVVGSVLALRPDTLALEVKGRDAPLALPLASLTMLEVSRGQKSSWRTGAIIGAVSGAAAGAILGGIGAGIAEEEDATGSVVLGGVAGAAVVGGLGALIGSLIKVDRWETVPLDRIRVSFTPTAPNGLGATVRVRWSP